MEAKKIIEELLLERDAEMVHYSTDEAIKSHKERCNYLIGLLDKQEQGLLIELPVKVGDTVYLTERLTVARGIVILKCNVDEFTVTTSGCYAVLNGNESYYALQRFRAVKIENFGKTIFLTRSEAEEALAKMKGE